MEVLISKAELRRVLKEELENIGGDLTGSDLILDDLLSKFLYKLESVSEDAGMIVDALAQDPKPNLQNINPERFTQLKRRTKEIAYPLETINRLRRERNVGAHGKKRNPDPLTPWRQDKDDNWFPLQEVEIKGSELKQIVAEELSKLVEPEPSEPQWQLADFIATKTGPLGRTKTYTDPTRGRGKRLAQRANIGSESFNAWAAANPDSNMHSDEVNRDSVATKPIHGDPQSSRSITSHTNTYAQEGETTPPGYGVQRHSHASDAKRFGPRSFRVLSTYEPVTESGQIKGSELKQIVAEELSKLLQEQEQTSIPQGIDLAAGTDRYGDPVPQLEYDFDREQYPEYAAALDQWHHDSIGATGEALGGMLSPVAATYDMADELYQQSGLPEVAQGAASFVSDLYSPHPSSPYNHNAPNCGEGGTCTDLQLARLRAEQQGLEWNEEFSRPMHWVDQPSRRTGEMYPTCADGGPCIPGVNADVNGQPLPDDYWTSYYSQPGMQRLGDASDYHPSDSLWETGEGGRTPASSFQDAGAEALSTTAVQAGEEIGSTALTQVGGYAGPAYTIYQAGKLALDDDYHGAGLTAAGGFGGAAIGSAVGGLTLNPWLGAATAVAADQGIQYLLDVDNDGKIDLLSGQTHPWLRDDDFERHQNFREDEEAWRQWVHRDRGYVPGEYGDPRFDAPPEPEPEPHPTEGMDEEELEARRAQHREEYPAATAFSDTFQAETDLDPFSRLGAAWEASQAVGSESETETEAEIGTVQEGNTKMKKKHNLLSERQVARMQKLSGIKPTKEVVLSEGLTLGGIALLSLLFVAQSELSFRQNLPTKPEHWPSRTIPKALSAIGRGIKSAWSRLVSKAEAGDSDLKAVVSDMESAGAEQAQRLEPEQVAMIQEKFGNDEQIAQMLSQLAEAPPEERQQILTQIDEYVKMKLST